MSAPAMSTRPCAPARPVTGSTSTASNRPTRRATPEQATGTALTLERLYALVDRLRPTDRQVVLLYLEDVDADAIAEVTGLSSGAVATRIHRIKALLAQGFQPEAAL